MGTCDDNWDALGNVTKSPVPPEEAAVASFEELARRNGIRVGSESEESNSVTKSGIHVEVMLSNKLLEKTDLRDSACTATQQFEEHAKRNGIRIGKESSTLLTCNDALDLLMSEKKEVQEGTEFEEAPDEFMENIEEFSQRIGITWTSALACHATNLVDYKAKDQSKTLFTTSEGKHFEELARKNGIEVGEGSEKAVTKCSHPSLSSTDKFKELANKNGIKVSRAIVAHTGVQTCTKDVAIEYNNCAVQVDAVLEAFEEEFVRWKLEISANEDTEEMSYKNLYFKEHEDKQELQNRLVNEMDLSVRTRRNHKRVIEELKKELDGKGEEMEV